MPEQSAQDLPYTNRELREKWHEINNVLQEIKTEVKEAKVEVKKTNGSVADLNRWRERVNGMMIASGVFMTFIVIPILAWAIYVLVNIQDTIHTSVQDSLSVYDLQIK